MNERQYYMGVNGQPQGPMTMQMLSSNGIKPDTLIWYEGMSGWVRADSLPELAGILPKPAPVIPPMPATPPPAPAPVTPPPSPAPVTPPPAPAPSSETTILEGHNPYMPVTPPPAPAPAPLQQPPVYTPAGYAREYDDMDDVNPHMALAILAMVFGGAILGVPALIFAIQCKAAMGRGDYEAAESKSRKAKIFGLIGLLVGIALTILVIIGIIVEANRSTYYYNDYYYDPYEYSSSDYDYDSYDYDYSMKAGNVKDLF